MGSIKKPQSKSVNYTTDIQDIYTGIQVIRREKMIAN